MPPKSASTPAGSREEQLKNGDIPSRELPPRYGAIFGLLLALRAVALFVGLDRLPLLPAAPPEVIVNDPAVALSRGYGLTGFSFEHSIHSLDTLYANFPPLFIFLQALVFRVLGFSAITLRASGAVGDLAACAMFLLVLRELYGRGIVDRIGLFAGGILVLLDPVTLIHDRSGRIGISLPSVRRSHALSVRSRRTGRAAAAVVFDSGCHSGRTIVKHSFRRSPGLRRTRCVESPVDSAIEGRLGRS